MFTRSLTLPDHSFFLFGPRGTGKTTWLKTSLKDAKWFDLLLTSELLNMVRHPEQFILTIEALPSGYWIVLDEVQKFPQILNDVQAIMTKYPNQYKFAMSGSSARKVKRLDANLLAGRAINRKFFPLTGKEMDFDFDLDELLKFGCLPNVRTESKLAVDILEAYVANYVRQEIQQEALVKDFASFARFLDVAAIMNAQVTNVMGIARDSGVARQTVQRYFDVLTDTLIGTWLPAWQPRLKVRESAHPKFYFFDTGVVRALTNRLRDTLDPSERGYLLETLILHELRAWINISNCGGNLNYWRTPAKVEVDFIWNRGKMGIEIEVKASSTWKQEFSLALKEILHEGLIQKAFGIYTGKEILKDGPVHILPLKTFMKSLAAGNVIPE